MRIAVDPIAPDALCEAWRDLKAVSSDTSPFRSDAWVSVWAPMAAKRCGLTAVRATDAGRTIGLAVFGIRSGGLLSGKAARLAETGAPALDAIYTEYNDVLLAEGAQPGVRRAMLEGVLAARPADRIVLRNASSALAQAGAAAAEACGWRMRRARTLDCFGAALGAPPPLSRNTRQQAARSRRLFEARGPLAVTVAKDPSDRAEAFADLLARHRAVWAARGEAGAFTGDALAFHERFVAEPDAPVEILTVSAGGEPIGHLYNLIGGRTVHNYQSGFAQDADNRLKPGLVTHLAAMDHYRERGFSDYDLMAGDSRYKRSLGFAHGHIETLVIERPGARQSATAAARAAKRRLFR